MAQDTGWPAVTSETHSWVAQHTELASRRARMRARGDYRSAVVPKIADATVRIAPEVQTLADDASRALTRFDAEAGHLAAPFASLLLRTESASSSQVENLSASAKQVALAEIGGSDSGNARLIVANVSAMQAALDLADNISEDAILTMHHELLAESAPDIVGRFRDEQVWIGGGWLSPHDADFVPPHHEHVPALMSDLVKFAHRTDIPALTLAAITHAQFETIHPFPDGNGRTGRALMHSMLRHGDLTRNVTVPVSAGLLHNTAAYFDALTAYRDGSLDDIVTVVAEASFLAIANGTQLIDDFEAITASWESVVTRKGSAGARLKSLLLQQPVVTTKIVSDRLAVSAVAAQSAIDRLVDAGVLAKTKNVQRNRIWHAPEVLRALDEFAARARRRPAR